MTVQVSNGKYYLTASPNGITVKSFYGSTVMGQERTEVINEIKQALEYSTNEVTND